MHAIVGFKPRERLRDIRESQDDRSGGLKSRDSRRSRSGADLTTVQSPTDPGRPRERKTVFDRAGDSPERRKIRFAQRTARFAKSPKFSVAGARFFKRGLKARPRERTHHGLKRTNTRNMRRDDRLDGLLAREIGSANF